MEKWLKHYWILLILVSMFLVLRLPAINQVYHQDEHRWVMQADPRFDEISPHPPLAKYYFRFIGLVAGFGNIRWAPLLFSLGSLVLVYLVSLKLAKNKVVVFISSVLFSINIYSIIASLQIDIDGAILPFFVLLGFLSYINLLESEGSKYLWGSVFIVSVIGGFLTKLSFALFLAALLCDYCLRLNLGGVNIKKILKLISLRLVMPILVLAIGFYFIYVKGSGGIILDYASHFKSLNFGSRAYFDLAFKVMKSLVWLSPLLTLPVAGGILNKEIFKKYFFWYSYLAFNLLFYLVIFDFAKLTIERYLMFLIVPSALISGEVLCCWANKFKIGKNDFVAPIILISAVMVLIFLPYEALPLNPKEGYVEKIKNFELNFLIPFSGGSGPIGFYFSVLFVFVSWFVSVLTAAGAHLFKKHAKVLVSVFIMLGVTYNFLFFAEYSQGYLYGSPDKITKLSLDHVLGDQNISGVITYHDVGAYELKMSNKYSSRFYTAPTRDYTKKLIQYRGYYMIIDFPAIDKTSEYWKLISRCALDKKFTDKYVNSYIFDCRSLPPQ